MLGFQVVVLDAVIALEQIFREGGVLHPRNLLERRLETFFCFSQSMMIRKYHGAVQSALMDG